MFSLSFENWSAVSTTMQYHKSSSCLLPYLSLLIKSIFFTHPSAKVYRFLWIIQLPKRKTVLDYFHFSPLNNYPAQSSLMFISNELKGEPGRVNFPQKYWRVKIFKGKQNQYPLIKSTYLFSNGKSPQTNTSKLFPIAATLSYILNFLPIILHRSPKTE